MMIEESKETKETKDNNKSLVIKPSGIKMTRITMFQEAMNNYYSNLIYPPKNYFIDEMKPSSSLTVWKEEKIFSPSEWLEYQSPTSGIKISAKQRRQPALVKTGYDSTNLIELMSRDKSNITSKITSLLSRFDCELILSLLHELYPDFYTNTGTINTAGAANEPIELNLSGCIHESLNQVKRICGYFCSFQAVEIKLLNFFNTKTLMITSSSDEWSMLMIHLQDADLQYTKMSAGDATWISSVPSDYTEYLSRGFGYKGGTVNEPILGLSGKRQINFDYFYPRLIVDIEHILGISELLSELKLNK
jgi:hypothetical protein